MTLPDRLRLSAIDSEIPGVALVDKWIVTDVNSNSWTVNNRNFGDTAVGSTRHLIAVITCQDNQASAGSDAAFTFAVTIGGVSATIVNSGTGGANGSYEGVSGGVAIAVVSENTLTSGTVSVTLSGFSLTMDHYGLAIYRAAGLSTSTPTTTPTTSSMTVPSNGFGVMGAVDVTNLFGILGAFNGVGSQTAYSGPAGAAMLRTNSGTVISDSVNGSLYRGATWTFI